GAAAEIEFELCQGKLAAFGSIDGVQLALAQRERTLRQQLAFERSWAEAEIDACPIGRQPSKIDPGLERAGNRETGGRQWRQLRSERGEGGGFDRTDFEREIQHPTGEGIAIAGVELGCPCADCDRHRQVAGKALRLALQRGVDAIRLPMPPGSLVVEDEGG